MRQRQISDVLAMGDKGSVLDEHDGFIAPLLYRQERAVEIFPTVHAYDVHRDPSAFAACSVSVS